MKIREVTHNNRKRVFEVRMNRKTLPYPYAKCVPPPSRDNKVADVWVDSELGGEGITYRLASGEEGTVHEEQILEYNEDPTYLTDLLLYKLTLEAQNRVRANPLPKREIIRRLGTSAAQFYRLLDQTNYRKSVNQMLTLLHILNCEIDFVVRNRKTA